MESMLFPNDARYMRARPTARWLDRLRPGGQLFAKGTRARLHCGVNAKYQLERTHTGSNGLATDEHPQPLATPVLRYVCTYLCMLLTGLKLFPGRNHHYCSHQCCAHVGTLDCAHTGTVMQLLGKHLANDEALLTAEGATGASMGLLMMFNPKKAQVCAHPVECATYQPSTHRFIVRNHRASCEVRCKKLCRQM